MHWSYTNQNKHHWSIVQLTFTDGSTHTTVSVHWSSQFILTSLAVISQYSLCFFTLLLSTTFCRSAYFTRLFTTSPPLVIVSLTISAIYQLTISWQNLRLLPVSTPALTSLPWTDYSDNLPADFTDWQIYHCPRSVFSQMLTSPPR